VNLTNGSVNLEAVLMKRYHINPRTGNPGFCRAVQNCRFGGLGSHFETKEDARVDYELSQELLARVPRAPQEMFSRLEKEVARGVELLSSARTVDGSAFGSSEQTRAIAHWEQSKFLIAHYVNKGETWADRRGYYTQLEDHIRGIKHEFGVNRMGGPRNSHKPLVEYLTTLEQDFHSLSGPDGAARERELGFFKGTKTNLLIPRVI
jgi:hypothetical protein